MRRRRGRAPYSEDGGVVIIVESVSHLFNPILSAVFKRCVSNLGTIPAARRQE